MYRSSIIYLSQQLREPQNVDDANSRSYFIFSRISYLFNRITGTQPNDSSLLTASTQWRVSLSRPGRSDKMAAGAGHGQAAVFNAAQGDQAAGQILDL